MVHITINDVVCLADKDQMILSVCQTMGIDIPTFCTDDRLVPHGACRMCLVELVGRKNLVASCSTPVEAGMVIYTHSAKVMKVRKTILELMWASHDNNCLVCHQAGQCKLQDYCYQYDVVPEDNLYPKRLSGLVDDSNKFYAFYRDKCILCGKCVRICSELQGTSAITFSDRGYHTHVTHPFEAGMEHSDCVSCGNCVNVCPTGALVEKKKVKYRTWDIDRKVETTCGYCGVGCQIEMSVAGGQVVDIQPVTDRVNQGLLCVKGKFAYNFIHHPDRLTSPLIRKDGVLTQATWDEAYDLLVDKIHEVKNLYGSQAFAGLTSARCTTEDNYVMQKFFRAVLGSNSIDHCARL